MKPCALIFIFSTLILSAGCSPLPQENQVAFDKPVVIGSMSAPGVERSIVRITNDIYRFIHNIHTSLFVLTDSGVVLIDPLSTDTAEWVKREIESRFGKSVTHILYSHGHEDHASGAAVFEGAEIISHFHTLDVITPRADAPLGFGYGAYDQNGDGLIEPFEVEGELPHPFTRLDTDANGIVTGQEVDVFYYRDVLPPTQTYEGDLHQIKIGGKTIEMHFVGGNHAADMSYIFFPEESIVFYVDVISLGALPFGELPWYSQADSQNTYEVALSIDADIAIPSHGRIGTQDDVRALQSYMGELRQGVLSGMDAGLSLEEIQETLVLEKYADWDHYEERRPQNIAGMYRVLKQGLGD